MTCLANDLFKVKMQNLIWDGILRDTEEWKKFCHDKKGVTDFLDKSQTIIELDCLIEKLGNFNLDPLAKENYTELMDKWAKTKNSIKF